MKFLNAPGMTIRLNESEVSGSITSVDSLPACAIAPPFDVLCISSNNTSTIQTRESCSENTILVENNASNISVVSASNVGPFLGSIQNAENNETNVSNSIPSVNVALNTSLAANTLTSCTNPFLDCGQNIERPNSDPYPQSSLDQITHIASQNPFLEGEYDFVGHPEINNFEHNINIKVEKPIQFLNEECAIEIIDDDFVALSKQLAVDHEDVDSEEELNAEFDFLMQSGKTLPKPMKIEPVTDDGNGLDDYDSSKDVVLGIISRT